MRALGLVVAVLAGAALITLAGAWPAAASAGGDGMPQATTLNFAVMRNGERIGTSTVRLQHTGGETIADVATRIQVKIGPFTVYRFEQSESERWRDGRLLAMTSHTNDNGTIHRVSAARSGDRLVVDRDGGITEADPGLMPFSPWNAALLRKRAVLSTNDGSITPLSVTDHGEEQLVLGGQVTEAHHYSLRTSFPQDVWYDHQQRLLQVELHGSDGSKIRYQPG